MLWRFSHKRRKNSWLKIQLSLLETYAVSKKLSKLSLQWSWYLLSLAIIPTMYSHLQRSCGFWGCLLLTFLNASYFSFPHPSSLIFCSAIITTINHDEVWFKRPDGSKSKLYISQLQKGKYSIKHNHNWLLLSHAWCAMGWQLYLTAFCIPYKFTAVSDVYL